MIRQGQLLEVKWIIAQATHGAAWRDCGDDCPEPSEPNGSTWASMGHVFENMQAGRSVTEAVSQILPRLLPSMRL